MSMRIVPSGSHADSHRSTTASASAPSAPGLHDTLRHGLGPTPTHLLSSADQAASRHPLEARLKAWEATQEQLRMESLRKTFGIAEPVRRAMELNITSQGSWTPLALASSAGSAVGGTGSVHEDILRGKDASVDWEDVFTGEEQRGVVGIHEEMERKLKI